MFIYQLKTQNPIVFNNKFFFSIQMMLLITTAFHIIRFNKLQNEWLNQLSYILLYIN